MTFGAVIECLCVLALYVWRQRKHDIERKRRCLFCFFLCLRLLAKTRYVLVSQKPLLGFLQKSYDVEQISFSK